MKYMIKRGSNGFATHHRPTFMTSLLCVTYDLIISLAYFIKCFFLLMPFIVFWYVAIGVAIYDVSPAVYVDAIREVIYQCFLINLFISACAMCIRLGQGPSFPGSHDNHSA